MINMQKSAWGGAAFAAGDMASACIETGAAHIDTAIRSAEGLRGTAVVRQLRVRAPGQIRKGRRHGNPGLRFRSGRGPSYSMPSAAL